MRLLISFAPQDRKLKDQLVKHLRVLERFGHIDLWTSDRIRPGGDRRQETNRALEQADVALLLISANFLASEFLQDVEVPTLFRRHEQGGLRVIPVLLRSCHWDGLPWLRRLKMLPKAGKAVASFKGDGRERALAEVAMEIGELVRALLIGGAEPRSSQNLDAKCVTSAEGLAGVKSTIDSRSMTVNTESTPPRRQLPENSQPRANDVDDRNHALRIESSPDSSQIASFAVEIDFGAFEAGKIVSLDIRYGTVFQQFLDDIWSDHAAKFVPPYSYGNEWTLVNTANNTMLKKRAKLDRRLVTEAGVVPGARLAIRRL